MKTTQNCLQEMVDAIKGVEPNEVAENKTTQTLLREIADAINNETTTDEGKNTQTLLGDITEAIRESGGGSDSITADLTTLDVTPTTEAQNIKPTAPIDGYDEVNVSAVTAAIDSNITAGNIKKDVQILGVTGSYEGSSGGYNAKYPAGTGGTLYADDLISSLEEWEVPYGWNDVGTEGFTGCSELTYIKIPSSVTLIGSYAFMNCSKLTTVILENGLITINDEAFENTGIVNLTIPSSVTSIGTNVFNGCTNLVTITIHKAEGSISGAPWGAPNTTTVVWDG